MLKQENWIGGKDWMGNSVPPPPMPTDYYTLLIEQEKPRSSAPAKHWISFRKTNWMETHTWHLLPPMKTLSLSEQTLPFIEWANNDQFPRRLENTFPVGFAGMEPSHFWSKVFNRFTVSEFFSARSVLSSGSRTKS